MTNFATTLVVISDEDNCEYHLTGKIMHQETDSEYPCIGYQFDLDQCDFNRYKDEDQNDITELMFYCYNADEDILDCDLKDDADIFELSLRKSVYSGTPYIRIGCRVFKYLNASNLYEFLCQRQDIKEYIDNALAVIGCKPEFVVNLKEGE